MVRPGFGIGAALLTPGSLSILEASFIPADRARAIGAWSGLSGVAIAAGPLIGGYLISAASWRWIFFINVPIAAAVVALGAKHVPESHDPSAAGKPDYAGAVAAVVFLSGTTFAFIEAPAVGWASPTVLAMALLGVAGLVALLAREHRAAAPMLPLSIFRERQFAAASALTFIVYAALTGATFLLPLVLQVVSGYSPLGSGLALLPLTFIMLALSARSGQLAIRIGPRLQLTVGPFVIGAGLAMLAFSTSGRRSKRASLRRSTTIWLGSAVCWRSRCCRRWRASPAPSTCARTRLPPDSGPRCSSRAGCAPRAGCSRRSRSPTQAQMPGQPKRPRPRNACSAASTRHH